jgi:hypothetical protein
MRAIFHLVLSATLAFVASASFSLAHAGSDLSKDNGKSLNPPVAATKGVTRTSKRYG